MKLGSLIELYRQKMNNINKRWEQLIIATANGSSANKIEENNIYSVEMSSGELALSKIMQKYEELNDIVFYISDAKTKIKIPELGVSINCAEEQLSILVQQLFNYKKIGQIISEVNFKITGVDMENSDIETAITNVNKGFDNSAIDDSVVYLEEEIKKYEEYIYKSLWSAEISYPLLGETNNKNTLLNELSVKQGTPKKSNKTEEVDLNEYVNVSSFLNQENKPATNCMICNSPYKMNIETFYHDTNGNMLATLDFAASDCGLSILSANSLLNHIESHNKVQKPNTQTIYNDPDKHIPLDHVLGGSINQNSEQKLIQQNNKLKNIAPGTFNPDQHRNH